MSILVPGPGPGAGLPLVANRTAPVSSMSRDSRSYLQRIIDEVSSSPCPGCKLPLRVFKVDQLGMCVTCFCGATVGFSASLPASRPESPAERKRAAAFAVELRQLASRLGRGRE